MKEIFRWSKIVTDIRKFSDLLTQLPDHTSSKSDGGGWLVRVSLLAQHGVREEGLGAGRVTQGGRESQHVGVVVVSIAQSGESVGRVAVTMTAPDWGRGSQRGSPGAQEAAGLTHPSHSH